MRTDYLKIGKERAARELTRHDSRLYIDEQSNDRVIIKADGIVTSQVKARLYDYNSSDVSGGTQIDYRGFASDGISSGMKEFLDKYRLD